MIPREFALHPAATADLLEVWMLVARNDGHERADKLTARIEAFIRSLPEFPFIGRQHDHRRPGLRVCAIPQLQTATVVFHVSQQRITVLRVGYLGRDVAAHVPESDENQ